MGHFRNHCPARLGQCGFYQCPTRDAEALMGIGNSVGNTSAEAAAVAAVSSPLLDEPVQDAKGVVFNV